MRFSVKHPKYSKYIKNLKSQSQEEQNPTCMSEKQIEADTVM